MNTIFISLLLHRQKSKKIGLMVILKQAKTKGISTKSNRYITTSTPPKNLMVEVENTMTLKHQAEIPKNCTCAHSLKARRYLLYNNEPKNCNSDN